MSLLYIYTLSSEGVHICHSIIMSIIVSTVIILLIALLTGILSGQQCML